MKSIVYVPGVWDLLHVGHIKTLERASKLGDILVVGVESDELVEKEKGTKPVISLENRVRALESIAYVDMVVPYYELDYVKEIKKYDVDVFVTCDKYQFSNEKRFVEARFTMKQKGKRTVYLPYNDGVSTTEIKNKTIENPWKSIWLTVGHREVSDLQVNSSAYTQEKVEQLANYFTTKSNIKDLDYVLDYGCGSGLVLKALKGNIYRFGIDISSSMLQRASKNNPDGHFICTDTMNIYGKFDHIISYGVFHYFPSLGHANRVIQNMKACSKQIIIMDIPDIARKGAREANRRKQGFANEPNHLYYRREFFTNFGFVTFDNEIDLTNNSKYGFTAMI